MAGVDPDLSDEPLLRRRRRRRPGHGQLDARDVEEDARSSARHSSAVRKHVQVIL